AAFRGVILLDDLRTAARSLRRSPLLSVLAVTTLGLGMAGTTALFGVVDLTLLQRLPFAHEEELVRVLMGMAQPDGSVADFNLHPSHVLALQAQAKTLPGLSAQTGRNLVLGAGAGATPVHAVALSPGSLRVLGVSPIAGRAFADDEVPEASALIAESFARKLFGEPQAAVGRDLVLDGLSRRVVGVLPAAYRFPYDAEVWIPLHLDPASGEDYAVFARLAHGATMAQANAELAAIAQRMPGEQAHFRLRAKPLRQSLADGEERLAFALLGVVFGFLLLACVNVATLLLARSAARARELAVRAALGASRARQLRQVFCETMLLTLAGGALGAWFAAVLWPQVASLVPRTLNVQLGLSELRPNPRVLAFAFGVSLLSALGAGIGPALHASRTDLLRVLKDGGGAGRSRAVQRPLHALAAGQMALAFALLCGAGAIVDGFRRLSGGGVGFDTNGLWLVRVELPEGRYADPAKRIAFANALQARAQALPGVTSAATTSTNPIDGGTWAAPVIAAGQEQSEARSVNHRMVTPGLLATLGIPLLRGRDFTSQDSALSERVVVVSERLARRLWPHTDALGQRLRIARTGQEWTTVVGVAADVKDNGDLPETWYLPLAQNGASFATLTVDLMVRAQRLPEAALRAEVAALDGTVAVQEVTALTAQHERSLTRPRFGAGAVAIFAAFGLLLAALGTYGVISFTLSQQTAEIGLRLALGSTAAGVLRLVLRRAGTLAFAGLLGGGLLALVLQDLLRSQLAEALSPAPWLFAGAALLLVLVAILAALVPALRAMRIEPAEALRSS
ncbi:MAG TPA: ADOP family duplicated permease, partial [Myxococcales bacterium]|nr:ADOP family duplicated permease [Myxococcales bacterium]